MRDSELGRTGLRVSRIALGLWQAGGDWGAVGDAEVTGTIRCALDLGVNFFDTAQGYGFGSSERLGGDLASPAGADGFMLRWSRTWRPKRNQHSRARKGVLPAAAVPLAVSSRPLIDSVRLQPHSVGLVTAVVVLLDQSRND